MGLSTSKVRYVGGWATPELAAAPSRPRLCASSRRCRCKNTSHSTDACRSVYAERSHGAKTPVILFASCFALAGGAGTDLTRRALGHRSPLVSRTSATLVAFSRIGQPEWAEINRACEASASLGCVRYTLIDSPCGLGPILVSEGTLSRQLRPTPQLAGGGNKIPDRGCRYLTRLESERRIAMARILGRIFHACAELARRAWFSCAIGT